MSKALSLDLRIRVLSAVSEGMSHRAAAARFGVRRWRALEREQGDHAGCRSVESNTSSL